LKAGFTELAARSKKLQETRQQAAKQNQQVSGRTNLFFLFVSLVIDGGQALQFLQIQQQQLQAIQQQIQVSSTFSQSA
jgi:hypothetical protein